MANDDCLTLLGSNSDIVIENVIEKTIPLTIDGCKGIGGLKTTRRTSVKILFILKYTSIEYII
ncbi:hypothetical protein [Peribacillus sp. V2I11]|uniref:hypothetical protein n=1 Tax=Peribacillus sp. V2I11 TaxID=3042277 RepID=UPI0027D87952|nr:hypothetical protein [Peribacillus sp. V2I11]